MSSSAFNRAAGSGTGIDAPRDQKNRTALHHAAADGNAQEVKRLLRLGADPNMPDEQSQTPLHAAITSENPLLVEMLVAAGAKPHIRDALGHTPLDLAIGMDEYDVDGIRALKDAGLPLDPGGGRNALHTAARKNRPDIIEYLVRDEGMDIDHVDIASGNAPVHFAVSFDAPDALRKLLDLGCNPNVRANNDETALMVAVDEHLDWAIDILLENTAVVRGLNNHRCAYKNYTALMLAVEAGNLSAMSRMIDLGADVNARDSEGRNSIFIAVMAGLPDGIRILADNGGDVALASPRKDGLTPMTHLVPAMKYAEILSLIMDAGANIDAADEKGHTALHKAAMIANPVTVDRLLKAGANPDICADNGYRPLDILLAALDTTGAADDPGSITALQLLLEAGASARLSPDKKAEQAPLHRAVLACNTAALLMLLQKNADPNERARGETGETPLHTAARKNFFNLAMHLIDNGADITLKDAQGKNILHHAAEGGAEDVAGYVCFRFSDKISVDTRDAEGRTALHYACRHNRTVIAERLLLSRAAMDVKDNDGYTPLHAAAEANGENIIPVLFRAAGNDFDWNARTEKDGLTPLHYAARGQKHKPVEQLLDFGADAMIPNKYGFLPVHDAILRERSATALILLAHMQDIGVRPNDVPPVKGWTLLHFAASRASYHTAALLLTQGADINAQNDAGDTPLHIAARHGRTRVVEYLAKKKGAIINIRNKNGETPFDIAVKRGHSDTFAALTGAAAGDKAFTPPPKPRIP